MVQYEPLDRARILVVDDEPVNLNVLKNLLCDEYEVFFATNGETALKIAEEVQPELILLDILMPGMDGYEVCQALKLKESVKHIPVIFVTVLNESYNEERGLAAGAVDYISKPFVPVLVKARIKVHLSLVQVEQLQEAQMEVVERLCRAAEFKDTDTSHHIKRVSLYCDLIAKRLSTSERWQQYVKLASPMHDVGKIGIPDYILNKPDKLTEEERAIVNTHPQIGADIIGEQKYGILAMARRIALEHHEKWDGTGYPSNMSGESICLEARICAIADVYDALTSERSYKKAWSADEAFNYIKEQSGKHFDPQLAEIFCNAREEVIAIQKKYNDADA